MQKWNKPEEPDAESESGSSPLWNEDFSHRPSWCDAKLALKQIQNVRCANIKFCFYLINIANCLFVFVFSY